MTVKNKSILALSAISLITYYFESLAWPLHLGRDGLNYIIYFIDIWAQKPVYQLLMLRRTPMAPVLYGGSLTLWGSVV
ncbi:MAG: hypothetical protein NTW32_23970, partial [Chloroflexi bacterium]|nr:hypothetical protein [Chloroflexota bacterium]